ncbi:MAG: MarC family protein [Bacteroidales bacterium]|nr:MAG: MarC family protein [Bacteroidales bacterium]
MHMGFSLVEIFAAFMVLFAVIDITGSIPIILDIKEKTGEIQPWKATLVAFAIMYAFLFIGKPLLNIFGVDISSFAIAGSFILLFLALEMVLGIQFFKLDSTSGGTIVPVAFPIIAGAGSITTLLSLKAEYSTLNIAIALFLNMILVYIVLKATRLIERILGKTGLHILKKIFGIILLAIAIKLFISNTGIRLGDVR